MDNRNKEQLFQYFKDSIQKESGVQIKALKTEIDSLKDQAEQAFEKELKEQLTSELENARTDLMRRFHETLTEEHHRYDLEIKDQRQKLMSTIFDELKERVLAFRQTPDYGVWLDRHLASFHLSDFDAIEIDPEDKILLQKNPIAKLVSTPGLIAGFILHTKDGKLLIDETFKSKIENAQQWFYDHSKWYTETEDPQ